MEWGLHNKGLWQWQVCVSTGWMNQASPSTRKLMKAAENALSKGNGGAAMPLLQQVLAINPGHAEALHMAGIIFHSAGDYASAEAHYHRALTADPAMPQNYLSLANLYDDQQRGGEAVQIAQLATQVAPNEPETHLVLVSMMMRNRQSHLAVSYLEFILPRFPKHTELRELHCNALRLNDRLAEADAAYQELCKKFHPSAAFRLGYELYLPRLPHTSEEIDRVRHEFAAAVERFMVEKPRVEASMLVCSPFFLAFHNRDNKQLLARYNALLRTITPSLNYEAGYCKGPAQRDAASPIRIAFICAHMYKHSVGDCYRSGMIYLAQQREFDVTFFNLNSIHDYKIQEIVDAGVRMVHLPQNIAAQRRQIEAFRPDIIIYPDIGMNMATHCLALQRLARVQCSLQGHPETTGMDTIDYVISSRSYEPDNAQENYTETLLCTDGIDTVFSRPKPPERWLSREELGLPTDKKLYVCPMAIQKFHPDFDDTLAALLERDPQATLVLFNDYAQESATNILRERILAKCDPSRVIFMQWQPLDVLYSILNACDAMLDTFYFGAGTTAQHAFGLGIPMVTMPGRWARGRVVHSYYSLMGIIDPPEAATPAEYVELAVRMANDATYKNALSQQLLAKNQRMFEQSEYGPRLAKLMTDIMAGDLEPYRR